MELEKTVTNLKDAGCTNEEIQRAVQLYKTGDPEVLLHYFRKCRCNRMNELHENQRKVDCLDYLIRQTAKAVRP